MERLWQPDLREDDGMMGRSLTHAEATNGHLVPYFWICGLWHSHLSLRDLAGLKGWGPELTPTVCSPSGLAAGFLPPPNKSFCPHTKAAFLCCLQPK